MHGRVLHTGIERQQNKRSFPVFRRSQNVKRLPCVTCTIATTIITDKRRASASAKGWKETMREEIEALERSKVWCLVKRPFGSNAWHTKWMFKVKTDAHGNLERLKLDLLPAVTS